MHCHDLTKNLLLQALRAPPTQPLSLTELCFSVLLIVKVEAHPAYTVQSYNISSIVPTTEANNFPGYFCHFLLVLTSIHKFWYQVYNYLMHLKEHSHVYTIHDHRQFSICIAISDLECFMRYKSISILDQNNFLSSTIYFQYHQYVL